MRETVIFQDRGINYKNSAEETHMMLSQRLHLVIGIHVLTKTKLRGLSPPANYTDGATCACRRS
jgi:hypothetical protein